MPHNVVRKSVNAISGSLGHLGEAFGLGLIFERIAREVNA